MICYNKLRDTVEQWRSLLQPIGRAQTRTCVPPAALPRQGGLLALVYFGAARLGLHYASIGHNVSLVWPPTGTLIPGVSVLFTSGYTDGEIARRGLLEPGAAFIQKPVTPAALVRAVQQGLDKRSVE